MRWDEMRRTEWYIVRDGLSINRTEWRKTAGMQVTCPRIGKHQQIPSPLQNATQHAPPNTNPFSPLRKKRVRERGREEEKRRGSGRLVRAAHHKFYSALAPMLSLLLHKTFEWWTGLGMHGASAIGSSLLFGHCSVDRRGQSINACFSSFWTCAL